jgi:hypothetical protein
MFLNYKINCDDDNKSKKQKQKQTATQKQTKTRREEDGTRGIRFSKVSIFLAMKSRP